MSKFEVLTQVGNDWENTWTDETTIKGVSTTTPITFDTREGAETEISKLKDDLEKSGLDFNLSDYKIVEIKIVSVERMTNEVEFDNLISTRNSLQQAYDDAQNSNSESGEHSDELLDVEIDARNSLDKWNQGDQGARLDELMLAKSKIILRPRP